MSQHIPPGSLERAKIQAKASQFEQLLESLSAIYQEAGLPPFFAREAALADLDCHPETLSIAA